MPVSSHDPLPFDAPLEKFQQQADALLEKLKSHDEAAHWRFKWVHPRFRDKSVADVRLAWQFAFPGPFFHVATR